MNDEYTPDFVLPTEDASAELKREPAPAGQPEPAPFAMPAFEPSMLGSNETPGDGAAPNDEAPNDRSVPRYETPGKEPVRTVPPMSNGAAAGGYAIPQARPAYTARPTERVPVRKSRYAIMSSWGVFLQVILMSIPGLGFLLALIWALGGCRKVMRRNIARAYFLVLALSVLVLVVGVLVLRFIFPDVFVDVFEYLVPGYTIRLY